MGAEWLREEQRMLRGREGHGRRRKEVVGQSMK